LRLPSNVDVNDIILSEETVAQIANYPVLDAEDREVPFGSLYKGKNGERRLIRSWWSLSGIYTAERVLRN
jgi:hypothetical protein